MHWARVSCARGRDVLAATKCSTGSVRLSAHRGSAAGALQRSQAIVARRRSVVALERAHRPCRQARALSRRARRRVLDRRPRLENLRAIHTGRAASRRFSTIGSCGIRAAPVRHSSSTCRPISRKSLTSRRLADRRYSPKGLGSSLSARHRGHWNRWGRVFDCRTRWPRAHRCDQARNRGLSPLRAELEPACNTIPPEPRTTSRSTRQPDRGDESLQRRSPRRVPLCDRCAGRAGSDRPGSLESTASTKSEARESTR